MVYNIQIGSGDSHPRPFPAGQGTVRVLPPHFFCNIWDFIFWIFLRDSDLSVYLRVFSWSSFSVQSKLYPYKVNFSRKKVNHFRKVSLHSSDGKSRKDVWILKYCQIRLNLIQAKTLCFAFRFQISVWFLKVVLCVIFHYLYINIFIYINNNIFSKMDASKTKLKSEIWKQKHTAFSFQISVCF